MSPYPHLARLNVGCVQYLNAKPLIYGYDGRVHFGHPAKLAVSLAKGALDVALVSTFEVLRMPEYRIVDGVSISSKGDVYSVFLAYRGDLKKIETVSLDPASLTAANLLRCILSEYHQLQPGYISSDLCADDNAARLLIGNQAIDFRRKHGEEYQYLDLGSEWLEQTALPFVFALWLVREDAAGASAAACELRKLKQLGVSSIPDVVRSEGRYDAAFETRYLTHHIRYDLGDAEKAGIEKFRELLAKNGLIGGNGKALSFI